MKTRLTTLLLASATLAPVLAQEAAPATPPPPPPPPADTFASYGYAWGEFGGSFANDIDVVSEVFNPSVGSQALTLEMDPGFAVQGGFGDQLTPWFGMEFQAGFLYNSFDDIRNTGNIQSFDGDLLQVPLFLNAIFTLPLNKRIQPFVGAGGGAWLSWLDASQTVITSPTTTVHYDGSDTEITAAYQAFAGVRFDFSDMSSVRLTYRLMGADGPSWKLDDSVTGAEGVDIEADSLLVQSISVGFLFEF